MGKADPPWRARSSIACQRPEEGASDPASPNLDTATDDLSCTVQLLVYDLLPPSGLATVLNVVGAGVYHSSVVLTNTDTSLGVSQEYAFGGHDVQGVTGIFCLPAGTAAQRMPGLRFMSRYPMGPAFGPEWERVFGPKRRKRAHERDASALSPTRATTETKEDGSSVSYSLAGSSDDFPTNEASEDPFRDPVRPFDDDDDEDAVSVPDGVKARLVVERMKREDAWLGSSYSLLRNNCNSFSSELIWRLTGKRAPGWINRAAWVATSLPCIVPEGWVDGEADVAVLPAVGTNSQPVIVAPPRADDMYRGSLLHASSAS